MAKGLLLIILFFAIYSCVAVKIPIYHRKLAEDLMNGYHKEIRPINHEFLPNRVYLDIVPQDIIAVNSRDQDIEVFCWNRMWWFDERLYWNASEYGNITSIEMMPYKLWVPTLHVENSIEIDRAKTERDMPLVLKPVFMSNGKPAAMIRRLTPQIYKLSCTDYVRHFPFDFVRCEFNYTSWTNDIRQLNLSSLIGIGEGYFASNLEWYYTYFNVEWALGENTEEEGGRLESLQAYLMFDLVIRRRATFYVYSMIVPACLAVQLSFFAMFLAADTTGDRVETVSLGFISLLGLSFLLIRVGDDTPKASDPEPLINGLFIHQVIAVSLAIGTSLGLIYLQTHGNEGTSVPRWLSRMLFFRDVERAKSQRPQPLIGDLIAEDVEILSKKSKIVFLWEVHRNMQQVRRILTDGKSLVEEDLIAKENSQRWRLVIKRIEIILLIAFSVWHASEVTSFILKTFIVDWVEG